MKALSLTQPWASLVSMGAKKWETRSWKTDYRGPLAIHASAGFPKWAKEMVSEPDFLSVLTGRIPGQYTPAEIIKALPRGQVLCTVRVVGCIETEKIAPTLCADELAFGDYTPGRWAWKLELQEVLDEPIPAKGALGLWEWRR